LARLLRGGSGSGAAWRVTTGVIEECPRTIAIRLDKDLSGPDVVVEPAACLEAELLTLRQFAQDCVRVLRGLLFVVGHVLYQTKVSGSRINSYAA
jgi:hypothetical protein